jgi:hypothetical protein
MVDVNKRCFPFDHNISKVHGAKTNTPPKLNTYERLPNGYTLLPWAVLHNVGNKPHSISSWFKMGLGWLLNTYFSHYMHEVDLHGAVGIAPPPSPCFPDFGMGPRIFIRTVSELKSRGIGAGIPLMIPLHREWRILLVTGRAQTK